MSARRVLDYLRSIDGRQTVSGIHNREPNRQPSLQTDALVRRTGKHPGLWSGDLLFSRDDVDQRWTMVRECLRQWEQGSIVQIMAHVAPPTQDEVCPWEGGIMSRLDDARWTDLVTEGGTLNRAWKRRLDGYATYLRFLKDHGATVLFRPLHEMNQGKFWWGGRPGPDGTARLYRLTREHLTRRHHLDNLVWVWDMQDMSRDFAAYDPGRRHWDVFAFDIYDRGYGQDWYDYVRGVVGDRPMAIGECDRLPTPALLDAQPRWCFFMSWAELTFEKNSDSQIRDLYASPRVLTRERLPRFR